MFVTSEMLKTIARPFDTLSSLLASTPQPGMRATASDAPGSMLYEVGGKWGGDLGLVSSDPALKALPTANMGLVCAYLANPLTPLGRTQLCLSSGVWTPAPGQLLYGAYGALLSMTAALLPLGAWNEVWQSPVLPEWMWACPSISLTSEAKIADATSTATAELRMSCRIVATSAGDASSGMLGQSSAASISGKGLSGIRARGNLRAGTIYGNSGVAAASASVQPSRSIGTYGPGTRVRLDVSPGASTNAIDLYSVELWAGG